MISREIISLNLFSMYSIMFDQRLIDIIQTKDKKKPKKALNKIFKGAKKTKAPKTKGTHRMADGSTMSGTTHTKNSKVVKGPRKSMKGRRSKY